MTVQDSEDGVWYCPDCSEEVSDTWDQCSSCGYRRDLGYAE